MGAVGAGCYSYGTLTVARDPEFFDSETIRNLLLETGVSSLVVVGEREPLVDTLFVNGRQPNITTKNELTMQYDKSLPCSATHPMWVSAVHSQRAFHHIKEAAHDLVVAIIQEIQRRKQEKIDQGGTAQHKTAAASSATVRRKMPPSGVVPGTVPFEWLEIDVDDVRDTELQRWVSLEKQLRADWKIIVLDQLSPNAFVHAMLPRRVFVHFGLLNHFCKNDDQLAAVLGHELSHVLLSHTEESMIMSILQSVAVAAVVSMLDFTGLFGFVLEIGAFSKLQNWTEAAHSREHECQADHLGEYLATMACYNPQGAVDVWNNATAFEKQLNHGDSAEFKFLNTHPLSTERAETMEKMLLPLYQLYEDCHCKGKHATIEWGRVSSVMDWEQEKKKTGRVL